MKELHIHWLKEETMGRKGFETSSRETEDELLSHSFSSFPFLTPCTIIPSSSLTLFNLCFSSEVQSTLRLLQLGWFTKTKQALWCVRMRERFNMETRGDICTVDWTIRSPKIHVQVVLSLIVFGWGIFPFLENYVFKILHVISCFMCLFCSTELPL